MNSLNEARKRRSLLMHRQKSFWFTVGFITCAVMALLLWLKSGTLFGISNEQSLGLPEAAAYETEVEVKALVSLCGAEVEATYTGFEILKEHKLAGKVYRTDAVRGVGKTRVAVCIDAEGYSTTRTETGVTVKVEPSSVQLLLPSVDHWGSQLEYNDGADWVGMLNPLVAENTDLIDITYMWLQLQATEGACMDVAWDSAISKLEDAIRSFESKRDGISRLDINIDVDVAQSLEESRAQVLKEINLSGVRERQALSLLQGDESIRVDKDHTVESCSVVGEV